MIRGQIHIYVTLKFEPFLIVFAFLFPQKRILKEEMDFKLCPMLHKILTSDTNSQKSQLFLYKDDG